MPNNIKNGAKIINLDEYSDIGTHWVALYKKISDITYFDSFGVEHIAKEIKAFIKNRSINPIQPRLLRAPQAWGGIKLSHPFIFSSSNSIDLKFGMNIIYNEKVSKNVFCYYDVIIYDDISILIISSPGF